MDEWQPIPDKNGWWVVSTHPEDDPLLIYLEVIEKYEGPRGSHAYHATGVDSYGKVFTFDSHRHAHYRWKSATYPQPTVAIQAGGRYPTAEGEVTISHYCQHTDSILYGLLHNPTKTLRYDCNGICLTDRRYSITGPATARMFPVTKGGKRYEV